MIETLGVSIETVRRDLLYMERSGLLNRVHGGAVSVGDMKLFNVLKQRNLENSNQKRLGKRLPLSGKGTLPDKGSTAVLLAEALKSGYSKLIVVTYSSDA